MFSSVNQQTDPNFSNFLKKNSLKIIKTSLKQFADFCKAYGYNYNNTWTFIDQFGNNLTAIQQTFDKLKWFVSNKNIKDKKSIYDFDIINDIINWNLWIYIQYSTHNNIAEKLKIIMMKKKSKNYFNNIKKLLLLKIKWEKIIIKN